MDSHHTFAGPPRFPVAKPYQPPVAMNARPCDFVPLQLVMVPSGLTVELTKPDQLLGRHSSADVRLPLADVSRRHCRVFFADSCWHIVDLGSLNGIFVNNQKVQEAKLRTGDLLRIGSFLFEVRLADSATLIEPRRDTRRAS
jgi:hypothetical protein